MRLYAFDGIGEDLELIPLAARRALDCVGAKLSLEAWRALSAERRRALVASGSTPEVDAWRATWALEAASPAPAKIDAVLAPPADAVPALVLQAFGPERPISLGVWSALTPLDRYALEKVATRGDAERLAAAYSEIIGHSAISTHLGPSGGARMVGVSEKQPSLRRASAESHVSMSQEAFERVAQANVPKGDVLGTARLAGIMAAKRTSELVPLCHPLALTKIDVTLELDHAGSAVHVLASVEAFDRTGVEMEALTAVSIAALTIYDMLKSIDRAMRIGPTRLLEKSGGRSGDFHG